MPTMSMVSRLLLQRTQLCIKEKCIEAKDLLHDEAAQFSAWCESLSAIPTINQLQERANTYHEEELDKCTSKLLNANLSEKELEVVERPSRGIVSKLLHGPMACLQKTESIKDKQMTLKELNAMFRLEGEEPNGQGAVRLARIMYIIPSVIN